MPWIVRGRAEIVIVDAWFRQAALHQKPGRGGKASWLKSPRGFTARAISLGIAEARSSRQQPKAIIGKHWGAVTALSRMRRRRRNIGAATCFVDAAGFVRKFSISHGRRLTLALRYACAAVSARRRQRRGAAEAGEKANATGGRSAGSNGQRGGRVAGCRQPA